MEALSTTALLQRVRTRDDAAFAELVRRHQGVLVRTARGLLGPGGPFEDVVQDAFLTLARKPPDLPTEAAEAQHLRLGGWLLQVTRNRCVDWLRKERRRLQRERELASPEATSGGIDAIDARDTRAFVERSLWALPEDQREVLVLRLVAEKSYREIAALTGRKVGTVGWLISRGLRQLADRLAPALGPAECDGQATSSLRALPRSVDSATG
ncbi:MAG: sigma-70 family RNA polymerase sigma factor [Planctomycetes bacterium]|nr:sigma-70 family RNA polymerase sigma factor [Planctomycetota bacterium]